MTARDLPRRCLDRSATARADRVDRLGRRSTTSEARRLRHFGFDEGVAVEPLHRGPFGRDPLAVRVGRMTVAIRRAHARAMRVDRPTAA